MEPWQAILLGSGCIVVAIVAVVILVSRVAGKLDLINAKLEKIEWAIAELERRVPDWLARR
jgi:hypothetical protein